MWQRNYTKQGAPTILTDLTDLHRAILIRSFLPTCWTGCMKTWTWSRSSARRLVHSCPWKMRTDIWGYIPPFSPFHSPFREGSGSRKLPPDDCRRAEGTWNPKWIQMKRMNAWRRQETQRREGMKKRTANYVAGLKVEASMIVSNDSNDTYWHAYTRTMLRGTSTWFGSCITSSPVGAREGRRVRRRPACSLEMPRDGGQCASFEAVQPDTMVYNGWLLVAAVKQGRGWSTSCGTSLFLWISFRPLRGLGPCDIGFDMFWYNQQMTVTHEGPRSAYFDHGRDSFVHG